MNKHTPGKWEISNGVYGFSIVTPWPSIHEGSTSSKCVCKLVGNGINPTPEQRANARLIASAPDLLASAKEVVEMLDAMYRIEGPHIKRLKAAIAKAEGTVQP